MKECLIGIKVSGKTWYGGSFQYWYSILQAAKLCTNREFSFLVLYDDDEWEAIIDEFGLSKMKIKKKSNWIITRIEHQLWRFPSSKMLGKIFWYLSHPARKIKKLHLDACVAASSGELLYAKVPMIVPIHDIMHRYEKTIPEMVEGYEYRERLFSFEVKNADVILVDSRVGKEQLIESYESLRKNLHNYVRILPFIAPSYIYESIEKKPQEELFDKFFFYPAQFWVHKNHISLLQAIYKLKEEKGVIINIVFVGSEQNNSENVRRTITELNLETQVKILGYVENEEIVYLYKHARAMIMPTLMGPTNIPQLEAFALGCPVATSRIYGIPEQVGDAALLFNPYSLEEIAECMEDLWTDDNLCDFLKKKGKEHANRWGSKEFAIEFGHIIREYFSGE